MVQDSRERYRGVLCLHCRQPIPLPAAIERKQAERNSSALSEAIELGPRAFALRCRACHGEGLYAESKFIECEGLPRLRTTLRSGASQAREAMAKLPRISHI
jgi:hypothetical protein